MAVIYLVTINVSSKYAKEVGVIIYVLQLIGIQLHCICVIRVIGKRCVFVFFLIKEKGSFTVSFFFHRLVVD